MFKVGDRVVVAYPCGYYASHVQGKGFTVDSVDTNRKDETWIYSTIEESEQWSKDTGKGIESKYLVLESVYNSPLYKALEEK